jgi:hypothetical protein
MKVSAPHQRDDDSPPKTKAPGSPARFKGVPRGPAKFRERDAVKIVKAARRAGAERVELMPDGRYNIILGEQARPADPNPWDEVHASHKERAS